MKKFFSNNYIKIIIGLVLLIINIILDLGAIPLPIVQSTPIALWSTTIISKITATIGLGLIVGIITQYFSAIQNEKNETEKMQEHVKDKQEFKTSIINTVKDNFDKFLTSQDFISTLSDEKKKEIIKYCLHKTVTSSKQHEYLEYKIEKLYNYFNVHLRSNIDYMTKAKEENGIVKLYTTMSYRMYKVNGEYHDIIHTFDKSTSKIEYMDITYKRTEKYLYPEEELRLHEENLHQAERHFVNRVSVPKHLTNETQLTVTSKVIEEGRDHWAHLVWMSLYPTDTISYKIICEDGLIIKDMHIFDDPNGLYKTDSQKDKNGHIISYNIRCDEWTDRFTGFSLIISKP